MYYSDHWPILFNSTKHMLLVLRKDWKDHRPFRKALALYRSAVKSAKEHTGRIINFSLPNERYTLEHISQNIGSVHEFYYLIGGNSALSMKQPSHINLTIIEALSFPLTLLKYVFLKYGRANRVNLCASSWCCHIWLLRTLVHIHNTIFKKNGKGKAAALPYLIGPYFKKLSPSLIVSAPTTLSASLGSV